MNLADSPQSLEEANIVVNDYMASDRSSRCTQQGQVLTDSAHKLVQKWYGSFLPAALIRAVLNAILYVVGGAVFQQKLGLPVSSRLSWYAVYALAIIRPSIMQFVPSRRNIRRLSDNLMNKVDKSSLTLFPQRYPPAVPTICQPSLSTPFGDVKPSQLPRTKESDPETNTRELAPGRVIE
ncbi:unnamed protein product [Rotaria magnacalcarata]|uniref:Uncharacterized protein n=1 Tax=Rotaria magnacalcarata TaxID=392030 RepID=A0A8S2MLJ6_9BILA|nr:unnamed protein product [Rotaria magnacalcarata]CAF3964146.1 unnamed protein product [Rotaria magnacalcarata]CAF4481541.1 unnamed protein product [Rotaria magnacalcarata]